MFFLNIYYRLKFRDLKQGELFAFPTQKFEWSLRWYYRW